MKIVYIAHAVGGNVSGNLADLRRIIRKINKGGDGVVPFAPYYADVVSLDDSDPADRARGIKNNIAILESGCVKELWLTGDVISPGMTEEVKLAERLGITVKNLIKFF
jgi:hypothetical protein